MEIFDINSLDVKTLRLLLAIADTGSVSAGAARRNMTQSTASYGLDKLRAAFSDPIFIRSGRGVAPSARGEEIIAGCRDLVERLDLLAAPVAFDPRAATRDFVIGAAAYELETLLPPLRRKLADDAPGCRLVIRAQDLDNQVDRLAHDWDLGLMTAPVDNPALKRSLLLEDHYVTFHDPATRPGPASLADYCTAPHAMATLGGAIRSHVDETLAAQGLKRRIALVVNSLESLVPMMRGSDLVTTLPRGIADSLMRDFAWTACPLPLKPLPIYMVWHARYDSDPGHRWLRGQLRAIARDRTMGVAN